MVNIHSAISLEGEYQNMEKTDEEHEEQGMNHALTKARPSKSPELKNRVNG